MSLTPRFDVLDRNYLINGGADYAQRTLGPVALTSTPSYVTLDRWEISAVGTFTVKDSRRTEDSPSNKTKYCHEFIFRRNATTGQMIISQKIESVYARDLIGFPVSLLMSNKFSEAPSLVTVNLYYANAEDNFSTKTLINSTAFSNMDTTTNQWNKEIINNINTIPNNARNGLMLEIVADFVNATDGTDQYYKQGEIKLSVGTKSQEFSYFGRDVIEDLISCQRYFEKTYDLDIPIGTSSSFGLLLGHGRSSDLAIFDFINFSTRKRVRPTVSSWTADGTPSTTSPSWGAVGQAGFSLTGSVTSWGKHFAYDAEL